MWPWGTSSGSSSLAQEEGVSEEPQTSQPQGAGARTLRTPGSSQKTCRVDGVSFKANKKRALWSSLVAQRVRNWHCPCSGSGRCCGVDLTPGQGRSACCGHAPQRRWAAPRPQGTALPTVSSEAWVSFVHICWGTCDQHSCLLTLIPVTWDSGGVETTPP